MFDSVLELGLALAIESELVGCQVVRAARARTIQRLAKSSDLFDRWEKEDAVELVLFSLDIGEAGVIFHAFLKLYLLYIVADFDESLVGQDGLGA